MSSPWADYGGTWHGPAGHVLRTLCLMTTAANADLEGVHDRMPVIIDPENWDRRLEPSVTEPESVSDPISTGEPLASGPVPGVGSGQQD